ncbi:MAG TPA: hypothetical protein VML75_17475 [Kofleriaceae bacterium]|nr:hypothetical protein [Kofleriaceae bacterium]
MADSHPWRRCSSCKTNIGFGVVYWACNVSTCNSKRMGLFFCSVPCWEAHLPTMRHREAWAVEERSPSVVDYQREQAAEPARERTSSALSSSGVSSREPDAPRRRVVVDDDDGGDEDLPRDILIVVSKLKKYIKARSGFSTSDNVMARLSDHVRWVADQAIRSAGEHDRKTVLDRDIPPVPRGRD